MLPYDKLQRGFANKQTTRNLRFSWRFAVERRRKKSFLPKLNWKTLANCVDKYLNQGSTLEKKPWGQLAPKFLDLVVSTNFLVAKKFSALRAEDFYLN